jgi:hypothetical protein
VEREQRAAPNVATIKVFRPSIATLGEWISEKRPPVQLACGYESTGLTTIFRGNARHVDADASGFVEIVGGDGEHEIQTARTYRTIPKGSDPADILATIAEDLGVSRGNLAKAQALLRAKGIASMFSAGGALWGSAAEQMTRVCDAYGLTWSIQDGALQILERDKPVRESSVFELSPETGLLGSPSVNRDNRREIEFKCLLNPLLQPGVVVTNRSKYVTGAYTIKACKHTGETRSAGTWETSAKATVF